MNIYTVNFYFVVNVDEEGNIIENEDDIDENNSHLGKAEGKFGIGSNNIENALLQAIDYLNENVGEDEWYISSIAEIDELNVVNWPGENDDCQCVACRTERAAPEDKITFECYCGLGITIVNDFNEFVCPNCGKEILRDRIIGSNGNYVLMKIDKENKS